MKNLFALVFFFLPLAVIAEEVTPSVVLKLPYSLETSRGLASPEENVPVREPSWLHQNCCVPPGAQRELMLLPEFRQRDPVRHLFRKKQRLQLYVVDPDKPELGRLSFERHQKMYGFWYRQEYGILDGSPRSLDFITRWFVTPETQ